MNKDRLPEQNEVLQELISLTQKENPDLILIAGDVFDRFNPPHAAQKLFYQSIKALSKMGQRPVVAIAGNHDSPSQLVTATALAQECGVVLQGYPDEALDEAVDFPHFSISSPSPGNLLIHFKTKGEVIHLNLTPYANEHRLQRALDPDNKEAATLQILKTHWKESLEQCSADYHLLMAHLYLVDDSQEELEAEPEGENPIGFMGGAPSIPGREVPEGYDYVALGHLHRSHPVDKKKRIQYSGSILPYSFSEAGQKKFVHLLELKKGRQLQIQRRAINRGKEVAIKNFRTPQEALDWLKEHPQTWVQVGLETEEFLRPEQTQQLYAQDNVCGNIIPLTKGTVDEEQSQVIDLSQDTLSLFKQYFRFRHGQDPNKELLEIFKEINAK